jgi:hypothetical protein
VSRDDGGRRRRRRKGNRGGYSAQAEQKQPVRDANRLRWIPPVLSTEPLPKPECGYCGKPIDDISDAINDKVSGKPVHFDCVMARLAESESLEKGESISYIGGGRFGIVRFNEGKGPGPAFTIRKIFEWEDKENRADWRQSVADHYSVT